MKKLYRVSATASHSVDKLMPDDLKGIMLADGDYAIPLSDETYDRIMRHAYRGEDLSMVIERLAATMTPHGVN